MTVVASKSQQNHYGLDRSSTMIYANMVKSRNWQNIFLSLQKCVNETVLADLELWPLFVDTEGERHANNPCHTLTRVKIPNTDHNIQL
jgi:hypothetical protein